MRHLAALAALLALSTACSRDVALPPEQAAARVTALSPASAYSGELVEVRGGPFAPEAAANLVVFPRASAVATALTPGGLLVRVPADAGSGPVSVTTPAGAGAPYEGFGWLGLGQPRGASITASAALLARPLGLHVVRGYLFAEEGLIQALVRLGSTVAQPPSSGLFVASAAPGTAAASGAALYLAASGPAGPELRRLDVATGELVAGGAPVTTAAGVPCALEETHLGLASGAAGAFTGDLVVAICTGRAALARARYAVWPAAPQPGGWAPLQASADLVLDGEQVFAFTPLADAAGGRIATLFQSISAPMRAGLVDFGASPPAVQWLARPAPYGFSGAFATAPTGAPALLAGATQDRRVAIVSTAAPSALLGAVDPGFSRNADLLALTDGGTLVATSLEDGLVVGIPLQGGVAGARVRWGWPVDRPTALRADGTRVWVASAGSNEVVALDEATGGVVARRSAEVRPRGLAYWPDRPGFGGADVVSAGVVEPGGWVDWPVGAAAPSGGFLEAPGGQRIFPDHLSANPALGLVFASGSSSVLPPWAVTTTARDRLESFSDVVEELALVGGATLALHGRGATVFDAAGRHEVVAFDDYQRWATPAVGRDGRILLGANNPRPVAEVRTLEGLLAGAPPLLAVETGFDVSSTAWLDGQPWIFTSLAGVSVSAVGRLTPEGLLADSAVVSLGWPVTASPNGRVLAAPNPAGSGVLLYAADPVAGFPVAAAVDVPGAVVGLAFDERGERLFVLTEAPAAISVIE